VDVSNEIALSLTVVMDVTIIEVESINIVVVIVSLFDITDDKGKEEYSVEVVRVFNKSLDDVVIPLLVLTSVDEMAFVSVEPGILFIVEVDSIPVVIPICVEV
jgi:hypothetical protein